MPVTVETNSLLFPVRRKKTIASIIEQKPWDSNHGLLNSGVWVTQTKTKHGGKRALITLKYQANKGLPWDGTKDEAMAHPSHTAAAKWRSGTEVGETATIFNQRVEHGISKIYCCCFTRQSLGLTFPFHLHFSSPIRLNSSPTREDRNHFFASHPACRVSA